MSHIFKGCLASLQFLLEGCAFRSADFDEVVFGVLSFFKHGADGASNFAHSYLLSKLIYINKFYLSVLPSLSIFIKY